MVTGKVKKGLNTRGSINPKDESFNFELWAKEVRIQMLQTLERKIGENSILN
jgi:hypothetical protein